jgi:hypothetical protein
MTVKAYEVIVSVDSNVSEKEVAIAHASQYLAYADQTDTFGYSGDVFDTHVYGGSLAVGLQFSAPFENDDAVKRFMDEMTTLARVESVEEIAYQVSE